MVLLIDNYDSFVHNLARYFRQLGQETHVVRNDAITAAEAAASGADAIVLSPGPLAPDQAGICLDIVKQLAGVIPILGVCLGHQVIGQALGGQVIAAPTPVHGRSTEIEHDGAGLFAGLPSPMRVGRYHSLVVDPQQLGPHLQSLAWDRSGIVMAMRHCQFPVFGIQFHPESLLTLHGYRVLANFLGMAIDAPVSEARLAELTDGLQRLGSLPAMGSGG
jgi:anthranilate synthase/aminodeoxychorismate synthase-like glutamine amidotransferase